MQTPFQMSWISVLHTSDMQPHHHCRELVLLTTACTPSAQRRPVPGANNPSEQVITPCPALISGCLDVNMMLSHEAIFRSFPGPAICHAPWNFYGWLGRLPLRWHFKRLPPEQTASQLDSTVSGAVFIPCPWQSAYAAAQKQSPSIKVGPC